jgi:hypothetical protein
VWLTLKSIEKLRPKFKGPLPIVAVSCSQCKELARAVQSGSRKVESWDYQRARLNSCMTCRKLRKVLEKNIAPSERSQLTGNIQRLVEQRGGFWTVTLIGDRKDINRASVDLVREGRDPNTKEGIGIRPSDHAIDKTLIASWIRRCDNNHAEDCHNYQNPWAQI